MKLKINQIWGLAAFLYFIGASNAIAEVVFDGTIGPNDAGVTRTGNFTIAEADGQVAGINLFHSFDKFNVNAGETANFTHTTDSVNNIIGRVTGGTGSDIHSAIKSDASLWLINPNGVAFHEGASVDIVHGTFRVSDAGRVNFTGGHFDALDVTQTSDLLTIGDPVGFGFLAENPGLIDSSKGGISFDGNVEINPYFLDKTGEKDIENLNVSIVGSDLKFTNGSLTLFWGAYLNLVSVNEIIDVDVTMQGLNLLRATDPWSNDYLVGESSQYDQGAYEYGANYLDLNPGKDFLDPGEIGGNLNINDFLFDDMVGTRLFGGDINIIGSSVDNLFNFFTNGNLLYSDDRRTEQPPIFEIYSENLTIENANILYYEDWPDNHLDNGALWFFATNDIIISNSNLKLEYENNYDKDNYIWANGNLTLNNTQLTVEYDYDFDSGPRLGEVTEYGSISLYGQNVINIKNNSKISFENRPYQQHEGAGGPIGEYPGRGLPSAEQFINIESSGNIYLEDSSINVGTLQERGDGQNYDIRIGHITVDAGNDFIISSSNGENAKESVITTNRALSANVGGSVNINVGKEFKVVGEGNGIFAKVGEQDQATIDSFFGCGDSCSDYALSLQELVFEYLEPLIEENGGLNISAESIILEDGAKISSDTYGIGNAGSIDLKAQFIKIGDVTDTNTAVISSGTSGSGHAGKINISAFQGDVGSENYLNSLISLAGDAKIQTTSGTINSDGEFIGSGTETGQAGSITLTAGAIKVDGATIAAKTNSKLIHDAATINITSKADSVENVFDSSTEKETIDGIQAADLSITSITHGKSNAGDVSLSSNSSILLKSSALEVSTYNEGNAGLLAVAAKSLELDNTEFYGMTYSVGDAGLINLTANTDELIVRNNSIIRASSWESGMGTGGSSGSVSLHGVGVIIESSNIETFTESWDTTKTRATINVNSGTGALEVLVGSRLTAGTEGALSAGDILLSGSSILVDNSDIDSRTYMGKGDAGKIELKADDGSVIVRNEARIDTSNQYWRSGSAGTILIKGKGVIIEDAFVNTTTLSENAADAIGSITIDGLGSKILVSSANTSSRELISANSRGDAGAGAISLQNADNIILNNVKVTSQTSSVGDAGDIIISNFSIDDSTGQVIVPTEVPVDIPSISLTGDTTVSASSTSSSTGNAGSVLIHGGSVGVNASTLSSATDNEGNAGSVAVKAAFGGINIENGSLISSSTNGSGDTIGDAGSVSLGATNGLTTISGVVGSETRIESSSNTSTSGSAGNVTIIGAGVTINDNVVINTATESSKSGNVAASITIDGQGNEINIQSLGSSPQEVITASTNGSTNAGSIIIQNASNIVIDNVNIESQTKADGSAGNIGIYGSDISVDGATITSSTDNTGHAGQVTLAKNDIEERANSISLANNSSIRTFTDGYGDANDIQLFADTITLNNSDISASTTFDYTDRSRQIGSSSNGDKPTAGDITLDSMNISILSGSEIKSESLAADAIKSSPGTILLGIDNETANVLIDASIVSVTTKTFDADPGFIGIYGENVELNNATQVLAEIEVSDGSGEGSGIEIKGGAVKVINASFVSTQVVDGSNTPGDILIEADSILVANQIEGLAQATISAKVLRDESVPTLGQSRDSLTGTITLNGDVSILDSGLVTVEVEKDAGAVPGGININAIAPKGVYSLGAY